MDIDIKAIIEGRQKVVAYRDEKAQRLYRQSGLLENLLVELKTLGFASLDQFFKANDDAVLADLQRCVVFEGACNNCSGKTRACEAPCKKWIDKAGQPSPKKMVHILGDGIAKHLAYYKIAHPELYPDFFKVKGKSHPLIKGCSITSRFVNDPYLDWGWL